MSEGSDQPPMMDYAPLPPRKRSLSQVLHALFAVAAGLIGASGVIIGVIGVLPPYFDVNGQFAFNMLVIGVIGVLCLSLSFHWTCLALRA